MIDGNCDWEEFKTRAQELSEKAKGSTLLFRGQASANWDLQTTLERSGHDETVDYYYQLILRIKAEVQTYTSQSWDDTPDLEEFRNELRGGYDSFSRLMSFGSFPHYAYMAYLRHHGFPSPLLDWSASPFVAAYFAFRESRDEDVAIFAFRERDPSGMKVAGDDEPAITQLGPFVLGPKRHLLNSRNTQFARLGNRSDRISQIIRKFAVPMTKQPNISRTLFSNSFCGALNGIRCSRNSKCII
jgi:FRG domain